MRILSSCASIAVAAWLGLPPVAAAQADSRRLGVYFDPQGTACHGTIEEGTPGTIYILGKVSGSQGFAGAAFRFTGAPSSWQLFPVPNPAMLSFGDPFDRGAILTFGECQNPPEGTVLLYTVLVLATEDVRDVRFSLEMRDPPDNPNFRCPKLVECDAPFFSQTCVTSEPCFVNWSQAPDCTLVAVQGSSWGGVKALFR